MILIFLRILGLDIRFWDVLAALLLNLAFRRANKAYSGILFHKSDQLLA